MLRQRGIAIGALALLTLAACSETPYEADTRSSGRAGLQASVAALAQDLAAGLSIDSARWVVRDAMRTSVLTEHKLVLQEFLRTTTGSVVLSAAAEAQGVSVAEFLQRVDELPLLDFYVPFRAHRLTWQGDQSIVVAGLIDPQQPLTGYSPAGHSEVVQGDVPSPDYTLILLELAERKSERAIVQPARAGLTIQDLDDGDYSGTLLLQHSDGRSAEYPLSRILFAKCDIETCTGGGGGGGSGGAGTTFLRQFETIGVCDNGFCAEGNEFEFRARGNSLSATLRIEGWPSTYSNTNLNLAQIGVTPASGYFIDIEVWETDGLFNDDDRFQWVTYSPNAVGDPRLTTLENGTAWPLKEQPHIGPFDPVKVGVVWGW